MKRILILSALALALVGCGSDLADTSAGPDSTTPTTSPTTTLTPTTTSIPTADTELDLLREARALWATAAPASYAFEYYLGCECDGGPWRVEVGENGAATVTHLFDGSTDFAHDSIDSIFDEIESELAKGEVPVRAEYHPEFGYPTLYVWNEPELPVDGGFILEITDFAAADQGEDQAVELASARTAWEAAELVDYDYTFFRNCFCAEESRGPYEVSVRDGEIVAATFFGTDLLDVGALDITSYGGLVLTVDDLFAEIDRSIGTVASLEVTYDADYGHPTDLFIDIDERTADEEIGYSIDSLRPFPTVMELCSTSEDDIRLTPQPGLPDVIAEKRLAIYDAAMACDLTTLASLTDPDGFNASFGGGDPLTLWYDAERRGEPVLRDMVLHLNTAYTVFGDGPDITGYTWPSAFLELEAPDGTGLPPEEFAELLELYTQDEIDAMFEAFESYAGYRIGIEPNGAWTFFVGGD